MNTTVSAEMARELREAGFVAPEISIGQTWAFKASGRVSEHYLEFSKDQVQAFLIYLPTALEIIAQMPIETRLRTWHDPKQNKTVWDCSFPLPGFQRDFRTNDCPHTACGLAFIAWKKGIQ